MTVEFWRNAEVFYELWSVVLSVVVILMIIALLFIFTYAQKENRLKSVFTVIVLASAAGLIGLWGHNEYYPYLEQVIFTNALIRDREPKFHTYTPYNKTEISAYTQLNHIDALRNMVLYEEEQMVEPLIYLGQGEHTHYFERSNGDRFRQNRQIQFTESAEQAQLVGSRFTLKDEQFKEIGFMNPENTMFAYIAIPLSEEGKTYTPEDEREFKRAEKVVSASKIEYTTCEV